MQCALELHVHQPVGAKIMFMSLKYIMLSTISTYVSCHLSEMD